MGGCCGFPFEKGHVAALRQRDDDGVRSALVELAQFVAEPPGIDPNDRISTAIEVRALPVQLVGDHRFLERMALPSQRLINDEREEAPQVRGSREDRAGEDAVELSANSAIGRHASRLAACAGFGDHRASVHARISGECTAPFRR